MPYLSLKRTLHELRKTPYYFPPYWLINRDPCNGLLSWSSHNRVVYSPIYTNKNQVFFSIAQVWKKHDMAPKLLLQHMFLWSGEAIFPSSCSGLVDVFRGRQGCLVEGTSGVKGCGYIPTYVTELRYGNAATQQLTLQQAGSYQDLPEKNK